MNKGKVHEVIKKKSSKQHCSSKSIMFIMSIDGIELDIKLL